MIGRHGLASNWELSYYQARHIIYHLLGPRPMGYNFQGIISSYLFSTMTESTCCFECVYILTDTRKLQKTICSFIILMLFLNINLSNWHCRSKAHKHYFVVLRVHVILYFICIWVMPCVSWRLLVNQQKKSICTKVPGCTSRDIRWCTLNLQSLELQLTTCAL